MKDIVNDYLDYISNFNAYIYFDKFNEVFFATTDEPSYDDADRYDCVVHHCCCPAFRTMNAAERQAESRAVIKKLMSYFSEKK